MNYLKDKENQLEKEKQDFEIVKNNKEYNRHKNRNINPIFI